jgi:predicted deacetylase
MDRLRWEPYKALVANYGIQPILAVVPDNRDSNLERAPANPMFWAEMRELQSCGATIGIHGYRHRCVSKGASLVPLKDTSEFAGVDERTQRLWIQDGLKILREHGLDAKLWVAPNHGFDRATLRALCDSGIPVLSDGLARVPFKSSGVVWIPQQLWKPISKSAGIWTICIHSNSAQLHEIEELDLFLRDHAMQFTSVDRIVTESEISELDLSERLYACCALRRIQLSRLGRAKGVRTPADAPII